MMPQDATSLLHLVGFLTGIILYAMLAAITIRSAGSIAVANGRNDRIPLGTALLGLIWNSGALIIYGSRDFGVGAPAPWLIAISFSSLGFLPAVVVHSALQTAARGSGAYLLRSSAYILSGVAAAMHVAAAALGDPLPSRPALLTLTVGYGAVIVLMTVHARRQPGWRRALTGVALAVFAVMALHLSQHTAASDTLPVELVGHHASLPLALVILYQDYRFALADLFLKRALTLLALIVLSVVLYTAIAVPFILPLLAQDYTRPQAVSALLALWIATALVYPQLRRGIAGFVDRVVLRRTDFQSLRTRIGARIAAVESAEGVLNTTCEALAPALSAACVAWTTAEHGGDFRPVALPASHAEGTLAARVPVPTAEPPAFSIDVCGLSGGRRLLSDDFALLEAVALMAARRIDALRVTHERYARDLREREMLQLAAEAELRALRAQLNPHFLFNALATIGYLVQSAPDRALDTLYRLTELLRAVLRPTAGELVTLREELDIVESYLAIERARFEERLVVAVRVPEELGAARIPPLLLQPLVENAVKHGIAPLRAGGRVTIEARLEPSAGDGIPQLCLGVTDTGAGMAPQRLSARDRERVGLSNIERRLERYYGTAASLRIESEPGRGTTAEVRLPFVATESGRALEMAS